MLLKNEGQALPLKDKETVAIFGRIQINYYRSGTGSGGSVNVPYTTNLLDGLRSKKNIIVNEELAAVYESGSSRIRSTTAAEAGRQSPGIRRRCP